LTALPYQSQSRITAGPVCTPTRTWQEIRTAADLPYGVSEEGDRPRGVASPDHRSAHRLDLPGSVVAARCALELVRHPRGGLVAQLLV
jgi:hypothetical protein